jgi:hypothetical protein
MPGYLNVVITFKAREAVKNLINWMMLKGEDKDTLSKLFYSSGIQNFATQ